MNKPTAQTSKRPTALLRRAGRCPLSTAGLPTRYFCLNAVLITFPFFYRCTFIGCV